MTAVTERRPEFCPLEVLSDQSSVTSCHGCCHRGTHLDRHLTGGGLAVLIARLGRIDGIPATFVSYRYIEDAFNDIPWGHNVRFDASIDGGAVSTEHGDVVYSLAVGMR